MSKIVSIHSYRGGTGKSNLTANLAAATALGGLRVGIVDTDIQSPGIHVLFGLDETKLNRSLNDYLWGRCAVEDTAYNITPPEVASHQGTMFLIPSSSKAGEIARILREGYDVGLLNDGFQELIDKLKLDYLYIDTHPGLNEETLLSIAISDVVVLILRPDKQDFQGTAVTVEVARKLNVQRLVLVVNKVLSSMNVESLKSQVEKTYNAPVAALFPLSEDVAQLASSGIFCLEYPFHAFTKKLKDLAQHIMA
ncbi:MAG: MinD/ParA family protein [Planctomycetia bacterium]|nr:MinD/ParA family protein [Planctomycetia bacterium]